MQLRRAHGGPRQRLEINEVKVNAGLKQMPPQGQSMLFRLARIQPGFDRGQRVEHGDVAAVGPLAEQVADAGKIAA